MTRLVPFVAAGLAVLGTLNVAYGDKKDLPKVRPAFKALPMKDAVAVLAKSKKKDELENAAISLCRDKNPEAIPTLLTFLKDTSFLDRMDDDIDYARSDVRVQEILKEIARNAGAKAEQILLSLAENKAYQPTDQPGFVRRKAIVKTVPSLADPSEKVLAYLDGLMTPESVESNYMVKVLVRTRNPKAFTLIRKYMLSDKFDSVTKEGWLGDLRIVRDKPDALALYKTLLETKFEDESFRDVIVRSLFAFDREPTSIDPPMPKPWCEVSTESLGEFLKLSDLALKFGISDETKEKVEKARKEIGKVLEKRKSEKK